ncbi:hypothetical protein Tco_1353459 [Tanacetum coccineum]
MSSSYSGSSISRASCLVELNKTHLGDNDTVFSHDTDFSSVNVSEANHWVYLHNNKRVLPIPPPVQKSKPREQKKNEDDYISPNEAKAMRELAMNKLQLKMQEIENNRDKFIKEIKKLNQKLYSLTKTSSDSNEIPETVLEPSTDKTSVKPPS